MIGMAFSFLSSRVGGFVLAGLVAASLGLVIYIQGLRLDAKDGEIEGLNGKISALSAQLDSAVGTNQRQAETIRDLTENAATAKARADTASRNLAAALARTDEKTKTIIREIPRAPSDNDPITAGERDMLVRLRAAYAPTSNRH